MAVRIAIVGPGKVGTCFARRFQAASAEVLGFVGRDAGGVRRAVADTGCGEALSWSDLRRAHCVIFAVGDDQLPAAVAAAAADGGRRCSLWLHTSGRYDLEVLEPAKAIGCRVGSMHPLAPFPGSVVAEPADGALALLQGEERSLSLLQRLARMLRLDPIVCGAQDRALYHAACALAANGATSLFGLAQRALSAAGGLDDAAAARVASSLMVAAVAGAQRHGAGPALSGPVRRGDDEAVRAHLRALAAGQPEALAAYRALSRHALRLAADEGLAGDAVSRVERSLADGEGRPGDPSRGGR